MMLVYSSLFSSVDVALGASGIWSEVLSITVRWALCSFGCYKISLAPFFGFIYGYAENSI